MQGLEITRDFYLLIGLMAIVLSGCASLGGPASATRQEAAAFNRKAGEVFRTGEYQRALRLYKDALSISRSLNDPDSIAMNLNGIASVYRVLGREDRAHRAVDEVLGSRRVSYSAGRRSDAAGIKALLHMDSGKYREAVDWSGRAIAICERAGCDGKWRFLTLKARALFLNGEHIPSLDFGTKGYWLSRKHDDRPEEANALRVMADARGALGEHGEEERLFRKAFLIDRDLGLSRKVFLDLMGMGRALQSMGKGNKALNYYQRALTESEADGYGEGMAEASAMIEKLKGFE